MWFSILTLKTILLLLSNYVLTEETRPNLETLQQVQMIFRHGLRSPEGPYPGDPYSNETFWPHGWGSLTNVGKKQQYELGLSIRKRYRDFLNERYSPKEFYAVSSDSDRTIQSALANIAGLYPPIHEIDQWNDKITTWQPIPVHTLPRHVDMIIRASAPCPRFDQLWTELLAKEPSVKKFNTDYQDLYDYVGNRTGEKYSYPIDLTKFYEALIIQEAHNYTLPEWTRVIYPSKKSSNLLSFAFSLVLFTEEMKRLRGGMSDFVLLALHLILHFMY